MADSISCSLLLLVLVQSFCNWCIMHFFGLFFMSSRFSTVTSCVCRLDARLFQICFYVQVDTKSSCWCSFDNVFNFSSILLTTGCVVYK